MPPPFNARHQWTAEEAQAVVRWRDDGYSWDYVAHLISQRFGFTVSISALRA